MRRLTWLMTLALFATMDVLGQVSFGNPRLFDEGWLFSLGDMPDAQQADYDDTAWRKLDLPHDYSVEGVM